jgi:acyl carrier protein
MKKLAHSIVSEAIIEVNLNQDLDGKIINSPEILLLNSQSNIDSLALVRLLIMVEQLIEEKTGKSVVVVNESTFETEESPFSTVGTLIAHVERLLA